MEFERISKEELVAAITASGIMGSESDLYDAITNMKRQKLLYMHTESIWQGNDGRYRTHIRDKTTGTIFNMMKSLRHMKGITVFLQMILH